MPFGVNPDLLLIIGVIAVTWISGIELGAQIMSDKLPDHVTEVAIQLGELHRAHEEAKQHESNFQAAKYRVNSKLASHIEQLKKLFTWE